MENVTKKRIPRQILEQQKLRTYFDVVPEDKKEEISKSWGDMKKRTLPAAEKHGMRTTQGESFNKVITFTLDEGYYHLVSGIRSTKDISPDYCDVGTLCSDLIDEMSATEKENGFTPLAALNVCDWDSAYAKEVGANIWLRDSVINACIKNGLLLPGGETANLGYQVRKKGMSWMFAVVSKLTDKSKHPTANSYETLDSELSSTFSHIHDRNYEIVDLNGIPLIHVKKAAEFILTADGTGSKSRVCRHIGADGMDIYDTIGATCDDATRDGAEPIAIIVGIHSDNADKRKQIINYIAQAGIKYNLPSVGSILDISDDVDTYIMNGVVLSEVKKGLDHIGKNIKPDLDLVLIDEEQRTNGITLEWLQLQETFGAEWYNMKASEAFRRLNANLQGKYSGLVLSDGDRTLGELVAKPSTPYFRIDSRMPEELLKKVNFSINVSSGGLIGKTRRLLEPHKLGAEYYDVFTAPDLVYLVQMASQCNGSKGVIPDEVAYSTWGCRTGKVIGTDEPELIKEHYIDNGINAKIGGVVTTNQEITIASKCLDAILRDKDYIIRHKYTEKPLG